MASAVSSGLESRDGLRQRAAKEKQFVEELDSKKPEKVSDGSLIDLEAAEKYVLPILVTGLALFTRLYQISKSNIVTWDEAHFGKFGSYYLKRENYFDVHPPLGKMLVGLSGYLAGYNGSFAFESGSEYPAEVNFVAMRVFNALFAAGCVPLAWFTARALHLSRPACALAALLVLLENGYITLGKLILLDSMLAFFTVQTFLCLACFHNRQRAPFTAPWWGWLIATGASAGCVCSVKMVGLFVTALVGVYTVADLWIRLRTERSWVRYAMHCVSRVLGLIVVPVAIFMLCFKIHFVILNHSGPGDANMSSLYQARLIGSEVLGGPLDVAIGSRVTLKNQGLNGGLLHSHVQTFPDGSNQQQVTTYHHKDSNNDWVIERVREEPSYHPDQPIQLLQDGDVIRLLHWNTGRNLHTHEISAPLTKGNREVSCYGNATIGDEKDYWVLEIAEQFGNENKTLVHPLSSGIRFRNYVLGCYLSGEGNTLPPWGFSQGEVTCNPDARARDKKTWWNVESHANERLPDAVDRQLPKTKFLRDFLQLNFAMMASNNALVPDPDKQDELASKAWQWPILHVGLRLCGWGDNNVRYYLLFHPTTTWLSSAGLVVFALLTAVYVLRWQRQITDFTSSEQEHYAVAGVLPALGWVFHYVPFLVMSRVTYVHHYMPALYFAILTFCFLVDHATRNLRLVRIATYLILYSVTVGIFLHFAPISFGMVGNTNSHTYLNWLSTWRI